MFNSNPLFFHSQRSFCFAFFLPDFLSLLDLRITHFIRRGRKYTLGAYSTTARTRKGARVNFQLTDRRLLAFNYVYGSLRLRARRRSERIGEPRGKGSGIPRRARRALSVMHGAVRPPAGDSATGCLFVAH